MLGAQPRRCCLASLNTTERSLSVDTTRVYAVGHFERRREIADWLAIDRCQGAATTTQLNARVSVETHEGCDRPVQLVTIRDAGHGWPGDGDGLASTIDTPGMIWAFLQQFRSQAPAAE